MKTKIIRVAQGKESTLSHLYIDGIFQCFLLEDKIREVKIMTSFRNICRMEHVVLSLLD